MIERGITTLPRSPAALSECSLHHAMILSTECLITDKPEPEPQMPPGVGGKAE